jgi:hypothetical protein
LDIAATTAAEENKPLAAALFGFLVDEVDALRPVITGQRGGRMCQGWIVKE